MSTEKTKNLVASVKARLTNISKKSKRDFSSICLQYCQERFLYRLSISEYKDKFILKGGLSLIAVNISSQRPTKDIDFLARQVKSDKNVIKQIFMEIIENNNIDDGLRFDTNSINTETIAEEALYEGIRVNIDAFLDKSVYKIVVDIGFSDKLVNNVELIHFPKFLDNFESPLINVYPLEAIISEKFEAIVKLYDTNSRLKDFYDIYFLSNTKSFDITRLHNNLINTFKNRNTLIESRKNIFSDKFKSNEDMNKRWQAFLRRNKLSISYSFSQVVDHLENFIDYSFENDSNFIWNPEIKKWEMNSFIIQ
jgi:predicted nucleotidyltransferase component of viral defense system